VYLRILENQIMMDMGTIKIPYVPGVDKILLRSDFHEIPILREFQVISWLPR